jgi:hypothetical protein
VIGFANAIFALMKEPDIRGNIAVAYGISDSVAAGDLSTESS